MATSRISTSSIKQGFPKSRSLLAGNDGFDPGAFFLIQRQTLASSAATVTFSSIPATYKNLQIRYSTQTNRTSYGLDSFYWTFNSDSGSNYAYHQIYGTGAAVNPVGAATQPVMLMGSNCVASQVTANVFSSGIFDVIDYASTTKYKTARLFSGANLNSTSVGNIGLGSGLWQSTSAVNSITVTMVQGTAINANSTFALYGMVG